jgi:hypothetical protein
MKRMSHRTRICLEWLGCHALAFAIFLPWSRMEGDACKYGFTALPLLFGCAQLYPLRGYVRWWTWLPATYFLGYIGSFCFLMLYFIAMGCTLAFAQGLCLLPRRPLVALAWMPLGAAGWFLAIQLAPVAILRSDGLSLWAIPFASYALAVLPAVLWLRKDEVPPPLP